MEFFEKRETAKQYHKRRYKADRNSASIHTTVNKATKQKLIELGDGVLNVGIERALQLANGKSAEVREVMLAIGEKIIAEFGLKQEVSCDL